MQCSCQSHHSGPPSPCADGSESDERCEDGQLASYWLGWGGANIGEADKVHRSHAERVSPSLSSDCFSQWHASLRTMSVWVKVWQVAGKIQREQINIIKIAPFVQIAPHLLEMQMPLTVWMSLSLFNCFFLQAFSKMSSKETQQQANQFDHCIHYSWNRPLVFSKLSKSRISTWFATLWTSTTTIWYVIRIWDFHSVTGKPLVPFLLCISKESEWSVPWKTTLTTPTLVANYTHIACIWQCVQSWFGIIWLWLPSQTINRPRLFLAPLTSFSFSEGVGTELIVCSRFMIVWEAWLHFFDCIDVRVHSRV